MQKPQPFQVDGEQVVITSNLLPHEELNCDSPNAVHQEYNEQAFIQPPNDKNSIKSTGPQQKIQEQLQQQKQTGKSCKNEITSPALVNKQDGIILHVKNQQLLDSFPRTHSAHRYVLNFIGLHLGNGSRLSDDQMYDMYVPSIDDQRTPEQVHELVIPSPSNNSQENGKEDIANNHEQEQDLIQSIKSQSSISSYQIAQHSEKVQKKSQEQLHFDKEQIPSHCLLGKQKSSSESYLDKHDFGCRIGVVRAKTRSLRA